MTECRGWRHPQEVCRHSETEVCVFSPRVRNVPISEEQASLCVLTVHSLPGQAVFSEVEECLWTCVLRVTLVKCGGRVWYPPRVEAACLQKLLLFLGWHL